MMREKNHAVLPAAPLAAAAPLGPVPSGAAAARLLGGLESASLRLGTAELRGLLPPELSGTPYAVSLQRRLDEAVVDGCRCGPTVAYYGHCLQVDAELAQAAEKVAAALRAAGAAALVLPPVRDEAPLDADCVDYRRAAALHLLAARRTGLGWIGKTGRFVSSEFGPRLRLATVLTDLPLAASRPPLAESRCGSCERCVRACPGRAATGEPWTQGKRLEDSFDAERCRQACRMQARSCLGASVSVCGICLAACPIGRGGDDLTTSI